MFACAQFDVRPSQPAYFEHQAGTAAYAASFAQDFPDASDLIEEIFERWDRPGGRRH